MHRNMIVPETEVSNIQRSLFSSQTLIIAIVGDPFRIFPILITENVSQNVSQEMHGSY